VYGSARLLALIPARGGSKGLPGKNIRDLGGKPLIAWTIEAARRSRFLDRIVVSTDSGEIAAIAEAFGAETPFLRPPELAGDNTPGIDVVLHALRQVPGFDYVVLLQPTSPLRTAEDIDAAVAACLDGQAPACVSVTESDKPPYWLFYLGRSGEMRPVLEHEDRAVNRQFLPKAYVLNGAIYIARMDWLARTRSFLEPETRAFPMPRDRSVDIDTALDFALAETLMREKLSGRVSGDPHALFENPY
jgi:CMP-N,N'-diacetyllegionaminic acid synthase